MTAPLPPLPAPDHFFEQGRHTMGSGYSEDQMHDYAKLAVREALERAMKICSDIEEREWKAFKGRSDPIDRSAVGNSYREGASDGASECGNNIRAMIEEYK